MKEDYTVAELIKYLETLDSKTKISTLFNSANGLKDMLPQELSNSVHINLSMLWNNGTEDLWNKAAGYYWCFLHGESYDLEKEMDQLSPKDIEVLTPEEFYDFLYNKFFVGNILLPIDWQQLVII